MVHKVIDFDDIVNNMNVFKDLETAKYSFHIAKLFSKQERMQNEILKRKRDIIEHVMDCLRDQEINIVDKKEAL